MRLIRIIQAIFIDLNVQLDFISFGVDNFVEAGLPSNWNIDSFKSLSKIFKKNIFLT